MLMVRADPRPDLVYVMSSILRRFVKMTAGSLATKGSSVFVFVWCLLLDKKTFKI